MYYHNIFWPLSTPIPFHSKINEQLLGCNQRQCAKSPQAHSGRTLYWQTNHWSQLGREGSGGRPREKKHNNRRSHGGIKARYVHIKSKGVYEYRGKTGKQTAIKNEWKIKPGENETWEASCECIHIRDRSGARHVPPVCLQLYNQLLGLRVFITHFLASNWPHGEDSVILQD